MKYKDWIQKHITLLSPQQKQGFYEYIPKKVYRTERNVSILVAIMQFVMMVVFMSIMDVSAAGMRTKGYFSLYVLLFVSTCLGLMLYSYTIRHKKYKAFLWIRRIYVVILCIWVIGMSYLEQSKGSGITVYCYLLPTTAALLLLSPLESLIMFVSSWYGLFVITVLAGTPGAIFGNIVNSSLVTILSLFISYRYYRSMANEYLDGKLIREQYNEIEKTNACLLEMANIDQLTGLYNRRYLIDNIYMKYEQYKKQDAYGLFMMMDIDFFKQYNDTFGHIQGDKCLRLLADAFQKRCEDEGVEAIRYGGEEFLFIKFSNQPMDAMAFAKQLQQDISDMNLIRTDIEEQHVTVSIGLYASNLKQTNHIESAIKYADDALYKAKECGRNCIIES